jgi:hypothetical protein
MLISPELEFLWLFFAAAQPVVFAADRCCVKNFKAISKIIHRKIRIINYR